MVDVTSGRHDPMTLRLADRWVWDFWLAVRGSEYHAFYLQAPRELGDPELRHANATVGHAVSRDLRTWKMLPDALHPGPAGAWDDRAIWTGSVVEHEGCWYLFYTGTSLGEQGRIQRVGLAISDDLVTWEKHGTGPVIQADDRWYELYGTSSWPEQAWRDPWIVRVDDTFHALVTARSNEGPDDERGVIGHAISTDLLSWEVQPPLTEPGEFAHLEVPQTVRVEGRHLLVFCCEASRVSGRRRARLGPPASDAIYTVAGDGPLGPFDLTEAEQALPGAFYAGRLVRDPDGQWVWLAFVNRDHSGSFVGELSDPLAFQVPT